MILYKYMPFTIGESVVRNNTILFSQPRHFNDPFDMPAYPDEATADPLSAIFAGLRTMVKNQAWADNSGILSLTRTPVNALMWAHYAEQHHGIVIGIDVATACLTDETSNFIPAQFGSVIYASRRETSDFATRPSTGIAVGATHHFPVDHYEKLQRVFLRKPLYWAYEEEVRVVKCLKGISGALAATPSGSFELSSTSARDLHLYKLPEGSIRELYIGIRADTERAEHLVMEARVRHPHLAAFECTLDNNALAVGFEEYKSISENRD
ncbi:hypothetical protein CO663_34725 [Rhizobium anhuiense]|uniref:DUF2971 domain-containing protein n=2 Tax=Rhizobium TaxID=379 RepID=UPI000BE8DFB1|nr:DUF2971 domain-containing protein [Rhizobium anhuiense]PDS54539.1 hypothetical protein CO663_34725 [Rhizobium anhuiense]